MATLRHHLHIIRVWTGIDRSHILKIRSRDFVQRGGKIESRQTRKTLCKLIDGIVFRGERAVPAGVSYLELVRDIPLLRGLHSQIERTPVPADAAPAPSPLMQNAASIASR